MNYRHAYHAGNFADVVKHASLALALRRLQAKPGPLCLIDLHAGGGLYDLGGTEAMKTGEATEGIGRLWPAGRQQLGAPLAELLAPWLEVVQGLNPGGQLRAYPGSPELLLRLARPQDRLVLVELHPEEQALLRQRYRRDERVALHARDAWEALPALVPPAERRGLVLIDPPFEKPDEAQRLSRALGRAYRRWPLGCYLVWYPIKDRPTADSLLQGLKGAVSRRLLVAELTLFDELPPTRLNGCGLAMINPPWQLDTALGQLLGRLQPLLGRRGGTARVEWLLGESPADKEQ